MPVNVVVTVTFLSAECLVQMAELREENSALRKQLDSAQSVTHMDVVGDAEVASKVDKNANLQMTSDELSAPRTDQLGNSEAVEQQV